MRPVVVEFKISIKFHECSLACLYPFAPYDVHALVVVSRSEPCI